MTTLTTPEALDKLTDAAFAFAGEHGRAVLDARAHLASRIAELEAELAAVRVLPEKWRSEHIPVDGCCAKTYNTTLDALAYEVEANIAKAAREGK